MILKLLHKRLDRVMDQHWGILLEIYDIGLHEAGRKSFYYERLQLAEKYAGLKIEILRAVIEVVDGIDSKIVWRKIKKRYGKK